MALFKSHIATQISGSVGGTTYGHNKGGLVMRARSKPVTNTGTLPPNDANRRVNQSQRTRQALNHAQNRWRSILTANQRDSWNAYAANVPLPGALGEARAVSGFNQFVRSNSVYEQLRLYGAHTNPGYFIAPETFNLGSFTLPTAITWDFAAGLEFIINNTDTWATQDEGYLLCYISVPGNVSNSRNKTRTNFAFWIKGDSGTPPPNAQAIFPLDYLTGYQMPPVGAQVYLWWQSLGEDGRLTHKQTTGLTTYLG